VDGTSPSVATAEEIRAQHKPTLSAHVLSAKPKPPCCARNSPTKFWEKLCSAAGVRRKRRAGSRRPPLGAGVGGPTQQPKFSAGADVVVPALGTESSSRRRRPDRTGGAFRALIFCRPPVPAGRTGPRDRDKLALHVSTLRRYTVRSDVSTGSDTCRSGSVTWNTSGWGSEQNKKVRDDEPPAVFYGRCV
jgi:hypothetical protein